MMGCATSLLDANQVNRDRTFVAHVDLASHVESLTNNRQNRTDVHRMD